MIRNYIWTAFRHFWKQKWFTLINISGLSIGISAALVIYLIVQYDLSYEKFQKDGDRIYRVVSGITFSDELGKNPGVPMPLPDAVKKEVTGLESSTHLVTQYRMNVAIPLAADLAPHTIRKQEKITFADAEYFNIFQYEWLAGSKESALKEPFRVVLTESRAQAYFGKTSYSDLLGKTIIYDDSIQVLVSGIVKDLTAATNFEFADFISKSTIEQTGLRERWRSDQWGSINSSSQFFVKLNKGITPDKILTQIASLREKYRDNKEEKDNTTHELQPLFDIHFNAELGAFFGERLANKNILFSLLAVGGFLLLLGCINFINLCTAQASQRAKEIGIRKTLGGGRRQLSIQFFFETFMIVGIATLLSIALTPWLLYVFRDFIPPSLSFASVNQPHVWIYLALIVLLVTGISGFYPAQVLNRFQPVTAIKNQAGVHTGQSRKAWLRKTLTISQFVIAQFLVIVTLVFSGQISYSLNKDLGYKKETIVNLYTPRNFWNKEKDNRRFVLYEKVKAIPGIQQLSFSDKPPASGSVSSSDVSFNNNGKEITAMVEIRYADTAFFDLYNIKVLAGRNLYPSDTAREVVINQTYATYLGFKDPKEALGKMLSYESGVPIVGVIADFHSKSTREPIKPLIYTSANQQTWMLSMALPGGENSGATWEGILNKIRQVYKEVYPEEEYSLSFFDQSIENFYKAERNIVKLLTWASGLCIFISCLGLLGLVMFTTNSRVKEIGIRKVLGASIIEIVTLLSKDFMVLVAIAFLVAAPLAWIFANKWLQDYSYRTPIGWWIFAVCALGTMAIALSILSLRTIQAAGANPVKSLRSE